MAFGFNDLLKKAGEMLEQAKDVVADKIEDLSHAAEEQVAEMGGSDMLAQAKAKFEEVKEAASDKMEELSNSDILGQAKAKFEEVKDAASDKIDELSNSDMVAQAKAKFGEVSDSIEHHVGAAKDIVEAKIKDLTSDDSKPA